MNKIISVFLTITSLIFTNAEAAQMTKDELVFQDLYKELVEINTTLSVGSCTIAAEAMAIHLRNAGIEDIHIIVPEDWPQQGNLVASIKGSNTELAPILLLAHLDVVEAKREDWVEDPFKLIEKDGYYLGRGTADDKAMAAIFVDLMAGMGRSGYLPEHTLKLALTCGEETPNTFNGVSYLIKHHRELIDAKFALNEGGGGRLDSEGRPVFHAIQAGEKLYQDFTLEVTNPGGHSSRPRADNAIYQLAAALTRISKHTFPIEFNDTTRVYFSRLSGMSSDQEAKDLLAILKSRPSKKAMDRVLKNPGHNSILHTTCVTTMLSGGHALNALPQRAEANVNCRIFPGHTQEEIRQTLERVVDDAAIQVTFKAPPETTSPPPPLTAEILGPVEKLTEKMWPGIPVLPSMIAGGTDGRFLTPAGIPTYGISGLFYQPGMVNAHGLNERILKKSLFDGRVFLNLLVREYVGGK